MNDKKFKEVIATLGEQYGKTVTPLVARVYWQALKPYSDDEVEQALVAYISDPDVCQYWPQPGALIAKITGTSKQVDLSVEAQAINGWNEAYKAMQRLGQYQSVELSDPLAMKVVNYLGGWRSFCMMKQSDEQWRRKEFILAYKTLKGSENLPTRLTGICDDDRDKLESRKALERVYKKTEA